jgi:ATP-dependent helicase/nuclease subunit A
MEFIDFDKALPPGGNIDIDYINERADFLHEHGAISDEVFREIDTGKIADFFRTDIGRRAAAAACEGLLSKEKPFTLRTLRPGSEGTHQVLVQGVIDCCFEEKGKMILIDYKTSYIRPGSEYESELERIKHDYRTQIDLYREAVSKGTGMDTGEAYLYLFSSGEAIDMSPEETANLISTQRSAWA